MNKKTKKMISVLVAMLMIVMTFAEVPAVFADDETVNEPAAAEAAENEEELVLTKDGQDDTEDGQDGAELGDEVVDMVEDEEVFEMPEEVVKPEEDPEVAPEDDPEEDEQEAEGSLSLQVGEDGSEPLIINTDEGEIKIFPKFYIKEDLNKYYENTNGNIRLSVAGKWEKTYDGSDSAETEYNKLISLGWTFKYAIMDKSGAKYNNKDYDYATITKGVELNVGKDKKYYLKVTATHAGANPGDPEQVVNASSLGETIGFTFPAKPTGVKASCPSDVNTVKTSWKKVDKAQYYCVYQSKKKKVPSKPLAKTSKLKYEKRKVPACKKYYYYVRAMQKVNTGETSIWVLSEPSSPDTVKVNKFLNEGIHQIGWKAKLRKKGTLYSDSRCHKKKGGSIKKGVTVKVVGKYPRRIPRAGHSYSFQVQLIKKGEVVKKGWIKYGPIKSVKGDVAYKNGKALDWSRDFKEYYMNLRGFSSKTKYLIWTSTYTQRVNIFKGKKGHWKLYKTMRCTTGKFLHPTALTYNRKLLRHQYKRVRTKVNNPNATYFYYWVSFFSAGDGFHSIVWDTKTGRLLRTVKKNLQPHTLGCARMYTADAKWIYYHMPLRTKCIFR